MEKLACAGQFKWEFSNLSSTGPDLKSILLDLATLSTVLINGNPLRRRTHEGPKALKRRVILCLLPLIHFLIPGLELSTQNLSHVSSLPHPPPLLHDAIASNKSWKAPNPENGVGGGIRRRARDQWAWATNPKWKRMNNCFRTNVTITGCDLTLCYGRVREVGKSLKINFPAVNKGRIRGQRGPCAVKISTLPGVTCFRLTRVGTATPGIWGSPSHLILPCPALPNSWSLPTSIGSVFGTSAPHCIGLV